jgi:hypothetical protein
MQGQQDTSTHMLAQPPEPTKVALEPTQTALAPMALEPTGSDAEQAGKGPWLTRPRPTTKGVMNLLLIGTLLGVPSVAQATDFVSLPPELGTWGVAAFAAIEALREIGKWFHSDQQAKALTHENVELRELLRQTRQTLAQLQAQREQEQREAMQQLRDEMKAMMARASEPSNPRKGRRAFARPRPSHA